MSEEHSPACATRGSQIRRSPLEYRARGFAVRPARIFEQKRDCSQSKPQSKDVSSEVEIVANGRKSAKTCCHNI